MATTEDTFDRTSLAPLSGRLGLLRSWLPAAIMAVLMFGLIGFGVVGAISDHTDAMRSMDTLTPTAETSSLQRSQIAPVVVVRSQPS